MISDSLLIQNRFQTHDRLRAIKNAHLIETLQLASRFALQLCFWLLQQIQRGSRSKSS